MSMGWAPADDLFRSYLLPEDADMVMIDEALAGLERGMRAKRLEGRWGTQMARLKQGREHAALVLQDEARRREHATAVRSRRQPLVESLQDRLAGAPGLPPKQVAVVTKALRGVHVQRDVVAALTELGAAVVEPQPLPIVQEPLSWNDVRRWLAAIGKQSVWAYIEEQRSLSWPGLTSEMLGQRSTELRKTTDGSDEESLVQRLQQALKSGQLRDLLMYELLEELDVAAQFRWTRLHEVVSQNTARARVLDIHLPTDDLAYAVWCRRRYPDPDAAVPKWQAAVEQALHRRDLRAAMAAYATAPGLTPEQQQAFTKLTQHVAEFDAALDRARSLERTSADEAAAVYLALQAASNDPALAEGLARCAPLPPSDVTADVSGERVVVSWRASPSTAGPVRYTVVRRADHAPAGPEDGMRLAVDHDQLQLIDLHPQPGMRLHYGVIATRLGATSSIILAAPVALLSEVEDLVAEPATDAVALRWRLPTRCVGAEVERRAVTGRARSMQGVGRAGVVDRDAVIGERYAYVVRARYRFADGSEAWSAGAVVDAGLQEVPQPIRSLEVDAQGEDVVVRWSPPTRGEVRVLELVGDEVPRGVITLSALSGVGRRLPSTALVQRDAVQIRGGTFHQRTTLFIATVIDDLAAIGPHHVVDQPLGAVQSLKADRRRDRLQLTWVWPSGANQVRVLLRSDREPEGPADPLARHHDMSRAQYENVGCRLPFAGGDVFVSVRTMAGSAADPSWGPARHLVVRQQPLVPYRLDRIPLRGPRYRRLSVGAPDGPPLPEVVLVARSRVRPQSVSDGTELARLPGGSSSSRSNVSVPPSLVPPVHLRLFCPDGDGLPQPADPGDLIV